MPPLHEARFYQHLPDGRLLCTLCPHDCRIHEGGRGACGVRYHHDGKLYTLVYDKVISRHLDPVEKKPLFHFYPGSRAYSIATVGCNMRCSFCQNWQISQWPKQNLPRRLASEGQEETVQPFCPQLETLGLGVPGEPVKPDGLVRDALRAGAQAIAYTYTEPTIFYELAYDTAVLAREQGLKNIFVSNGFIGEAAQRQLAPVLDAANIDLKFFRDESYRRISRARLQPVLDAIQRYHELGVWLEVTTLVIPGLNDSEAELRSIAQFIHDLDPGIPWHVTQYYPAYMMHDRPPTPVQTLRRAREIGLETGLRHVFQGNVPGEGGENTFCPACHALLIERYGFYVRYNRIRDGRCPECGTVIEGVGLSGE